MTPEERAEARRLAEMPIDIGSLGIFPTAFQTLVPQLLDALEAAERERDEAVTWKQEYKDMHAAFKHAMLERDAARAKVETLAEALRSILNELGVPQPDYPAPITNAVHIARAALKAIEGEHES